VVGLRRVAKHTGIRRSRHGHHSFEVCELSVSDAGNPTQLLDRVESLMSKPEVDDAFGQDRPHARQGVELSGGGPVEIEQAAGIGSARIGSAGIGSAGIDSAGCRCPIGPSGRIGTTGSGITDHRDGDLFAIHEPPGQVDPAQVDSNFRAARRTNRVVDPRSDRQSIDPRTLDATRDVDDDDLRGPDRTRLRVLADRRDRSQWRGRAHGR